MIEPRLELHNILINILGSNNVYFQPPEDLRINYPCIIYSLEDIDNSFANNNVYKKNYSYKLIYIDKDPDSDTVDKIISLPQTRFSNYYTSEGLNHYVYVIYYK